MTLAAARTSVLMSTLETGAANTRLDTADAHAPCGNDSSLIDAGMWDLPRLCRYYGTWNRKSGEKHTLSGLGVNPPVLGSGRAHDGHCGSTGRHSVS